MEPLAGIFCLQQPAALPKGCDAAGWRGLIRAHGTAPIAPWQQNKGIDKASTDVD